MHTSPSEQEVGRRLAQGQEAGRRAVFAFSRSGSRQRLFSGQPYVSCHRLLSGPRESGVRFLRTGIRRGPTEAADGAERERPRASTAVDAYPLSSRSAWTWARRRPGPTASEECCCFQGPGGIQDRPGPGSESTESTLSPSCLEMTRIDRSESRRRLGVPDQATAVAVESRFLRG